MSSTSITRPARHTETKFLMYPTPTWRVSSSAMSERGIGASIAST